MNQFVDAAIILLTCPYRIGFLIAEKSYHQRVIGDFAKLVGCFPVSRPQDQAKAGPGKLYFDKYRVVGKDTQFKSLNKGDKLRVGTSDTYQFSEIISDTEGILTHVNGDSNPLENPAQGIDNWTKYEIMGYVDQGDVFKNVSTALSSGKNGLLSFL